ncbi:hypothetical protein [Leclercia pneumoniae]|uniref:hypothetical protein n=1 Tax=Leclercia pneumoniae TaxID=2815358 RepID=UPI000505AADA|nr:hypothetical protein DR73_2453 [Enterobacteriaceae bacterium ATCC 29904]
MSIITAEAGQYFSVSVDNGLHVYKVVAWTENERNGLDPLCVPVALYERAIGEWTFISNSASAHPYTDEKRPFVHFVNYFTCKGDTAALYREINAIAQLWEYPLINLSDNKKG